MLPSERFLRALAAEPLLVSEHHADLFASLVSDLATHPDFHKMQAQASTSGDDSFWDDDYTWLRPYHVAGGVLTVPVRGVLLNGFPYQFGNFATGYEYVTRVIARGLEDAAVERIALLVNSPGGTVSGCFDCADYIHASRDVKPIHGVADEHAYSAAYALISSAADVSVPRTGGLGSIGVVTMHLDLTAAMEKQGVKVTVIRAGKYKFEGNPYEKLSDEALARIQKRIDDTMTIFVATVARNRDLNDQDVRDTEALTFSAQESVSKGLADRVASVSDAYAAFAVDLSAGKGEDEMSEKEETVKAADHAAAVEAAKALGAKSERTRIEAIVTCDEAALRRDAAFNIALKTDLGVDQAKSLLATLPEAKPADKGAEKAVTTFEVAMVTTGNPNVGASGDGGSDAAADPVKALLADHAAMTGINLKK